MKEKRSRLFAPTIQLSGHEGEIFCTAFSPIETEGRFLATGSFDKTIMLWDVYGECENWGHLKGHSNAVLQLRWSKLDGGRILYSASADKTLAAWDVEAGIRIKKLTGKTPDNLEKVVKGVLRQPARSYSRSRGRSLYCVSRPYSNCQLSGLQQKELTPCGVRR